MKKALHIFLLTNFLLPVEEVPDMIIMDNLLLELVSTGFWGF